MSTVLDLKLNQITLLDRLANNLNIPSVTDSSNIKKISDAFEGEMHNLLTLSNSTLNNSIISRMNNELLEEFASTIGITRLRYGSIKLKPTDFVASVYIDANNRYDPTLKNTTIFYKNDVIYSNDTFTIRALEDIVFSNIESIIYPTIEIRLNASSVTDSFTISQFTILTLKPSEDIIIKGIPELEMLFNFPVGLAFLTEDIDDFRNRIYDTLSMSNNISNSLVYSLVQESPMMFKMELDNIEEGRAVSVLYPYTKELIEDNDVVRLNSILIPLVTTSLYNKYKSNLVYVRAPSPVKISVQVKTTAMPTLLDTIRKDLNIDYKDNKEVLVKDIKESIQNKLKGNATSIKVIYGSDIINYEGFELEDTEVIDLPIGKFLNITSIIGEF